MRLNRRTDGDRDVSNHESPIEARAHRASTVEFDVRPPRDYFPRMSSTADKLEQEIKSLPDIEKLRLVNAILADLDRPDPEIDRIWAEEARKRWDAYKAGRLRAVSYEEVMSKYRDQ
jgi:putative addiction module component (TIGR02574 family)